MIRERAAASLNVPLEDLESLEVKALLSKVIKEHLEKLQAPETGETDEGTNNIDEQLSEDDDPESIEDELDTERIPLEEEHSEAPEVPKKTRKRKVKTENEESKGPKKKRVTKTSQKEEEELARLKSFVFKCGVRKIWKKELEGLSTPASIAKVKQILEELGLEGRPSLEKCKRIKESREYAEEMKIIDKDKILDHRLRSRRSMEEPIAPLKREKPRIVPRLDLSAYGDSE